MSSILDNCGPCNNVLCAQHGCQRKWGRTIPHPFNPVWPSPQYMPMPHIDEGTRVFDAQKAIAELEKRVKALEEKTNG